MQGITKAILLCGAAAMIGCASPALAKNFTAEIGQKQAEQAALEKKSKELVSEVGDLKTKLVTTARVLRDTENQAASSDKALKDLQARKSETLEKLFKEHAALGGLVAAAGKYNRTPVPQLLLLSDPLDAARAALVMKTLIPALHEHATALKSRIADMGRIETEMAAYRAEQSAQFQKLNKQQGALSTLLQERQVAYQKTEGDRKQYEKEVAALAKEARSLADLERKLQEQANRERAIIRKPAMAKASGILPANIVPPVAGTVQVGFGETDDIGATSEGLTFAARPGAMVVSPLSGRVKFAGPFQKYRQILIIEHPGGYHSLVAGLGRIDTVVGASLAAGEPVGIAGETPADSKIYYELRRNGEPVNPRPSMVAQRKQDKS